MDNATRVDILIVAALQDELDAVLKHFTDAWTEQHDRQGQTYFVRNLPQEHDRSLSLAAVCSGMGETAAAARTASLITQLNPAIVAMCGICAGKRSAVCLGDVIVAECVYSYDHGKLVQAEPGTIPDLLHDIETFHIDRSWRADIEAFTKCWSFTEPPPIPLQSQKDWVLCTLLEIEHQLGQPLVRHPERKSRCPDWKQVVQSLRDDDLVTQLDGALSLTAKGKTHAQDFELLHPDGFPEVAHSKAHIGVMATGKTVREDPDLFSQLQILLRKTIAVEMEAAAIGLAADLAGRKALVIKAVSDHADGEKDDRYRHFACRASAHFLLLILEKHGADWVRSARHVEPKYESEDKRTVGKRLDTLEQRRHHALAQRETTNEIDNEIVQLKRSMRIGGVLSAGDVLGNRYTLLDKIGEGGFATVWKAFDREQERTVAIKALHPQHGADRTRIDRFRRGAREMADLNHPAVVSVFDKRGDDDNHHYFAMEFESGGDLHQAVLAKRFSSERSLRLLLQVADALAYAHERGVMHRDVKPSNILLSATGEAKLTDFDLVAAAHTTGGTRTGVLGTAIYAAPELTEQPQHADVRADVYGLGMTTAFVIHGNELSLGILRSYDKFLAKLNCHESIRSVIRRAVEHEPADRFPTMIDFRKALEEALSNPSHAIAPRDAPELQTVSAKWKPNTVVRTEGFILELRSRPEDFASQGQTEGNQIARSFGDAWAKAAVLTEAARDLFLLATAEECRNVAALAVAVDGLSSNVPGVPEGTVLVVMDRLDGLPGWDVWVDARDTFFQTYGERIRRAIETEGGFPVTITSFDAAIFEVRTRGLVDRFANAKRDIVESPAFVDPGVRIGERVDSGLLALATWLKSDTRCALLVGPFGSGKTSLFTAFCRLQIAPWPIFVQLAQTKDGRDEEGATLDAAGVKDVPPNQAALRLLLRRRMLVICVDGLDERPLASGETLVSRLEKWTNLAGGDGRMLVSARGHYKTLEEMAAARSMTRMTIEPFDDERMRSILQRGIGDPEASRTWQRIQADSTYLSLARRPALLTAAGFGADIVEQFGAYLHRWIETTSCGAFGAFGSDARMQVAQALAATLFDTGYTSCAWSELRPEVRIRLEPLLGGLSGDEALNEIADGALLVRDAEGRYAFAHTTTQWHFLTQWLSSMIQAHPIEALSIRPLPADLIRLLIPERRAITNISMLLLQGFTEDNSVATPDVMANVKANALRILIAFARYGGYLQRAVPEGADLRGVRLMGESLAGVTLVRARLEGADLSGVDLTGADLTGADLSGARLLASRLDKTVLRDARLRGADLTYAAADACDLTGADLTDAVLRQSVWTHCTFDGANLAGADVSACVMTGLPEMSGQTVGPRWLEATVGSLSAGHVNQMAWSPTDKVLALGDNFGAIFLVEPSTLSILAKSNESDKLSIRRDATAMAWDPSGRRLAWTYPDGSLRLWDWSQSFVFRALITPRDPTSTDDRQNKGDVSSLAWHPREEKIVIAIHAQVRVLMVSSGEEMVRLEHTYGWPSYFPRLSIWHPRAEQVLLVGDEKGAMAWLDLRSGKIVAKTPAIENVGSVSTQCVIMHSHGARFALGDAEGRVTAGDVDEAGQLSNSASFKAHSKKVYSLALAKQRIATGGADSTAALWDATSGQCLGRLDKQRGAVVAVALDSRGERLVSGDGWGNIRSWDARHQRTGPRLGQAVAAVGAAAWAPNGERMAVAYDDGTLRLWDIGCGRVIAEVSTKYGPPGALTWDSAGTRIATFAGDNVVRIWHAEDWREIARLENDDGRNSIFDIAWDPSGQRIATSTESGPIVWEILTRRAKPLVSYGRLEDWYKKGQFPRCHSVCWDRSGKRLASGMQDRDILIWNVDSDDEATLLGEKFSSFHWGTECLAWDKAGKRIVSGGVRGLVLWDVDTKQEVYRCQGHTAVVTSVAWSPTEQTIASASYDGTARIWNAETGHEMACLSGHTDHVTAATWDPSGQRLATASKDGTIKIWNAVTYELLCTLEAAGPRSIARTPGGYCLFEDRGGEGPPFCFAARRPERPGSALFLPIGGLRDVLHRPDKVAAALRGDLSGDNDLEAALARGGLGGGVKWDGESHVISQ